MTPHSAPPRAIAYVEDVKAEAEEFKRRCHELGIANPVYIFPSGEELEQHWPDDLGVLLVDLVLLSVHHSQRQGLEVVEDARKRDRRLPIIVVTKTDDDLVAANAKRVGADGIIVKPIDVEAMFSELHHAGMSVNIFRRPEDAVDSNGSTPDRPGAAGH